MVVENKNYNYITKQHFWLCSSDPILIDLLSSNILFSTIEPIFLPYCSSSSLSNARCNGIFAITAKRYRTYLLNRTNWFGRLFLPSDQFSRLRNLASIRDTLKNLSDAETPDAGGDLSWTEEGGKKLVIKG